MRLRILLVSAALCAAAVARAAAPPLQPADASAVINAVRAPGATVVLVNVWATWCIPCREEMPDLLRLRRDYAERGLRLVLVSGDFSSDSEQAVTFLSEQGVDFPTYLKKGTDMDFINAFDPKWSGALPATFIYDGSGTLRHTMLGKGSYAKFEEKVKDVLAK